MIDHRLVTQGTDAYFVTEEALALARGVTDDGAMNTNRARGDTKGGHGKGGH